MCAQKTERGTEGLRGAGYTCDPRVTWGRHARERAPTCRDAGRNRLRNRCRQGASDRHFVQDMRETVHVDVLRVGEGAEATDLVVMEGGQLQKAVLNIAQHTTAARHHHYVAGVQMKVGNILRLQELKTFKYLPPKPLNGVELQPDGFCRQVLLEVVALDLLVAAD